MSPIYNFSDKKIYCFSDLEGSIPTKPNISKHPVNNVKRVIDILNNEAIIDNEAIVFTGDLIDRGSHNIILMSNLLNIKINNTKQVCLAIGNRDLNKIRLIDEYYIIRTNGASLWSPKKIVTGKDFKDLCDDIADKFNTEADKFNTEFKFKFNYQQLSGPLLNTEQAGWTSFKQPQDLSNIFTFG